MTKRFMLIQLFSIVDGRLSQTIDDVYDILNHVFNTDFMTHHLPVAYKYLKENKPEWFITIENDLKVLGISKELEFNKCLTILKANNIKYDIPQFKFNQAEFGQYMAENSLLFKKK